MNDNTPSITDDGIAAQAPIQVSSPILATVARFAVPLTIYVSLIIFFQGHNKPGGGFIAGVLAAAAGVMALLAWGVHREIRFPWWEVPLMALLLLPWAGPTASALTLVLGASFQLLTRGCEMCNIAWWKFAVLGMLISLATGIAPFLAGGSFMDHTAFEYHVLFWHEHLPTATFFDTGVYMIVFGTLTTVFVELGLEGD
ncbi:MAG: MnhB domain-containing protein [Phycisphaeraceae bacterium]